MVLEKREIQKTLFEYFLQQCCGNRFVNFYQKLIFSESDVSTKHSAADVCANS